MGFASIGCWLGFASIASIGLLQCWQWWFDVGSGGSVVGLWFNDSWCFSGGSGWFHGDSIREAKQKKFFG